MKKYNFEEKLDPIVEEYMNKILPIMESESELNENLKIAFITREYYDKDPSTMKKYIDIWNKSFDDDLFKNGDPLFSCGMSLEQVTQEQEYLEECKRILNSHEKT